MSPDTFLEPLYRWLYSVADWLLESSTMNGWVRFFEGLRMVEGLLLVALLALGFGLGAVFVIGCYATELGRQARFLGCRERLSNARLTCGSRLPGMVGMADAVNAEIDAADAERVEALHAADEFSRGLSALSHDVRTPLTGARGYLQLAREEADPARKDEQLATAVLGFINNNNIKQEYLYNQRKFFDAGAIENFAKAVYKESCTIFKAREDARAESATAEEVKEAEPSQEKTEAEKPATKKRAKKE